MINHYDIKYSTKELKLIRYYKFDDLVKSMYPEVLYNLMAKRAFLDNDQGEYADSLRRCIKAFDRGDVYRMTEEWDVLISV